MILDFLISDLFDLTVPPVSTVESLREVLRTHPVVRAIRYLIEIGADVKQDDFEKVVKQLEAQGNRIRGHQNALAALAVIFETKPSSRLLPGIRTFETEYVQAVAGITGVPLASGVAKRILEDWANSETPDFPVEPKKPTPLLADGTPFKLGMTVYTGTADNVVTVNTSKDSHTVAAIAFEDDLPDGKVTEYRYYLVPVGEEPEDVDGFSGKGDWNLNRHYSAPDGVVLGEMKRWLMGDAGLEGCKRHTSLRVIYLLGAAVRLKDLHDVYDLLHQITGIMNSLDKVIATVDALSAKAVSKTRE